MEGMKSYEVKLKNKNQEDVVLNLIVDLEDDIKVYLLDNNSEDYEIEKLSPTSTIELINNIIPMILSEIE